FIPESTSSLVGLTNPASVSLVSPSFEEEFVETRSIPQTGHDPGASLTTWGCIGQVYLVASAVADSLSFPLHAASKRMVNKIITGKLPFNILFILNNHLIKFL